MLAVSSSLEIFLKISCISLRYFVPELAYHVVHNGASFPCTDSGSWRIGESLFTRLCGTTVTK